MNNLDTLLAWATDMAVKDPDEAARPLWAQIAAEVEAYVTGESVPVPADTPSLFGGDT